MYVILCSIKEQYEIVMKELKSKRINNHTARIRIIHTLYFILLFAQVTLADNMETLYEVSVKVSDNKTENELINEGFSYVLIKVSGDSEVLTSPAYSSLVAQARSALSQFRYDDISASSDPSVKEKWFWVRFNPKIINNLLNIANIPIWGSVRPNILIWLSQKINGEYYLHDQHEAPDIYKTLNNQANQRGISLIYPFLDLQDRSNMSIEDIWNHSNNAILLASKRYQAQAILTSRIFQDSAGTWVSQWSLLMLGETQNWKIRDNSLLRAVASGIDELADKLADQLAQTNDESRQSGLFIQISNINDFNDFQHLDDYFRSLATVKSLSLIKLEHDKIIYKINHLGKVKSLIQEIEMGDLLSPIEAVKNDFSYDDKDYKPVVITNTSVNTKEAVIAEKQLIDLDYWLIR